MFQENTVYLVSHRNTGRSRPILLVPIHPTSLFTLQYVRIILFSLRCWVQSPSPIYKVKDKTGKSVKIAPLIVSATLYKNRYC